MSTIFHPTIFKFIRKPCLWLLVFSFVTSFTALEQANPSFVQVATTEMGTEEGKSQLLTEQPYSIKTGINHENTLLLELQYSHWQNASIIIGPYNFDTTNNKACIKSISVNGTLASTSSSLNDAYHVPICAETLIDLSPYLTEGINHIALEISSDDPEVLLSVNSQLFGTNVFSTLACLWLLATVAIMLFMIVRWVGLNTTTSAIATVGMAYYALWLHLRPDLTYTSDVGGHISYIRYMVHQWSKPYAYTGHEGFHPPLYYLMASLIFKLFNGVGAISPLTAVRAFSLGLYSVFFIYGLRTLDEAVKKKGPPYYLGVVLIMFWPVAVDTATNITNDIAIYAVWGPMFYYLVRWLRERNIFHLHVAIVLTGVAFMIKSSAWLLAVMLGGALLYTLCTRQLPWRQLLQSRSLITIGLLLLGIIVNLGKPIYRQLSHGGAVINKFFGAGHLEDNFPRIYFYQFDFQDFLTHPYATFKNEHSFLNYFLKTMLYSQWTHPGEFAGLPSILNVLLLALLIITISGTVLCLAYRRYRFNDLWPHIISIIISFAAVIEYTLVQRNEYCQSFRHILPTLVPLVILFVSGMETTRVLPNWRVLYFLGMAVGIGFSLGAVVLYLSPY